MVAGRPEHLEESDRRPAEAVRTQVAALHGVGQAQLDGVNAQTDGELVDGALEREVDLRHPRSSVSLDRGLVRGHLVHVDPVVRKAVGPREH